MRLDVRALQVTTIWTPKVYVEEVLHFDDSPIGRRPRQVPVEHVHPEVLYGRVQITRAVLEHYPVAALISATSHESAVMLRDVADLLWKGTCNESLSAAMLEAFRYGRTSLA